MRGAEAELERCLSFYKALGQAAGLGETCRSLLPFLEKLKQFAGGSVKRCRDKNLEEAFQLLAGMSKGFWELEPENTLPLVHCVLTCQMETLSSSGSFSRLEKIVVRLSEGNRTMVSEQVDKLMGRLTPEDKKPMSAGALQTACIFIEKSVLGRCYWRSHLPHLLRCVATTFDFILQDQTPRNEQWLYITVKTCLQLFKGMPEGVSPLVWDETEHKEVLQKILRSLVQAMTAKAAGKDTRLLAGTAVSMLVNTGREPREGAMAALGLFRSLGLRGCSLAERKGATPGSPKGEGRFGVLSVPPAAWSPDGLGRLVLTRGLLACCKKQILSCQLAGAPPQACLLLDVLLPAVLDLLEEPVECHYYCFQAFSLWLQRVRDGLDEIWKAKQSRVLADNSSLLQRLTQFLWNSAESPVEGVSDFIHQSLRLLLEIYTLECDHFDDTERSLYGWFLQKIMFTPWQLRARYFVLIAVLPYLDPGKVLETYRDLPQHLLNCLSTNHLCPAASELYKTILQLQRKVWTGDQREVAEEELARKWGHCWLPTVSSALTSPVSFLQSNASNYILGWTLRLFPGSYALLAGSYSGRDASQLRAWVTLLKVQKSLMGSLPGDGEALERLGFCLSSEEENVRLAALGLLCCSPRTNQALSTMEIQLLKAFLPLNLNCDSSSFRQLLQAAVKKALVRARESSLALLRRQALNRASLAGKDPEVPLEQAVDFVEWLLHVCISSLMPGSNYQRRKSGLLLLEAILETCTETWRPERKKGQPPCSITALLSWARRKGCWDFFSTSNTLALLSCLQDGTNEIHELASELLIRYFPPTFPESIAVALFVQAQEAMRSPRVQDVEAGAVLMKTILQKSDLCTLERLLPEAKEETDTPCQYLCLLRHLLKELHVQFTRASQDFLQAARTAPIHGVLAALRRCLLDIPEVAASASKPQQLPQWQFLLSSLVDTTRGISSLLLGRLQSKQSPVLDPQAVAPSFADMGKAIGCLIQLGKDLAPPEDDDSVLLSEEHGLILTCCWVSVKEIGLLLGGLVEKFLPLSPPASCRPLLPLQLVNTVAKVFQDILLKCRHWGAVEGCSVGFTRFCTALLSHPDPELQNIPRTMLDQGLALLRGPRSSSITRRAAGFPMLFLCIVAGEDPGKPRPLLASCVQELLALAGQPLPQDWDQTVDLPQVSAVHVLQTLVRGSGLGTALHQYITPMVMLFLGTLSSPSWAMRNAGIQLFSALTVRLLGQKQNWDGGQSQDGVSSEALFGRYPQLKSILLAELTSAVEASVSGGATRGQLRLCPSLYAILTFLAKLLPGADTLNSDSVCFLEPLIQLSGNPIYAVRVMAARALVPLVPVTEYGKVLLQLAGSLPQPGDAPSHNALHGCLLQTQSVLARALEANCLPPDALLSITRHIEDRLWLISPVQQCPLVRTVYLQIVSLLVEQCSQSFVQRVWEIVISELTDAQPVETPGFSPTQVGSATFCQQAVGFLCHEATGPGHPGGAGELCLLLLRGNTDTQRATLAWMVEQEDTKSLTSSKELQLILLEKINELLTCRTDQTLLKLHLEALVHLCATPNSPELLFPTNRLDSACAECKATLLSLVESGHSSPDLLGQALCVVALLLTPNSEDFPLWERWSAAIGRCSSPLSSEVLRMAAAKSLKLAGAELIGRAQESSSPALHVGSRGLIHAAVRLLQDEDQAVRKEAAAFASRLVQQPPLSSEVPPRDTCAPLQSSKALLRLLQLQVDTSGNDPEALASLLQHLPATNLADALAELEMKGTVSLYKEDEPNVYAEPAFLSQMLLPFLLQLLHKATTSPTLWESMQCWLTATGPGISAGLQHCRQWWSRDHSTALHLKALGCAKVHAAVTTLLVKAVLAIRILETLEGGKKPSSEGIAFSSQELRRTACSVQKLLAQRGMAPMVSTEMEQSLHGH
ncbi:thyroid adenoma-associated protein homolog [Varanus komodoensis]|uniref:thyroid adenoma-associated protein homolog n=1 Tax=Varanus komodoensis TaxID=61221 RepID=UPI001CF76BDF|nr:thyroid adenoma-associated protein homolog [Varanus komodoensis]